MRELVPELCRRALPSPNETPPDNATKHLLNQRSERSGLEPAGTEPADFQNVLGRFGLGEQTPTGHLLANPRLLLPFDRRLTLTLERV